MSTYKKMTEVEVEEYVRTLPGLFSERDPIECQEFGDGNMNLVFRVHALDERRSFIVKQALPYIRSVGESWPLTLDRARIEYEILERYNDLCPGLAPKTYHFNKELALFIMEDLTSHLVLRKGLIHRNYYPRLAAHLGTFLARTLFSTSDMALGSQEKKRLMVQFNNPELCEATEDAVLTFPYLPHPSNRYNPLLENVVREIWHHDELQLQIQKCKDAFLTRTQALIHGDLHSGSIMVTETDTKVIDPEFAFYGPIGFDIGLVFANLLLNYCSQEDHTYRKNLLRLIQDLWRSFVQEFKALWSETEAEPRSHKYIKDYLDEIFRDSLGFAGCEMMRRIIGISHVEDLEGIEDPVQRAEKETLSLQVAQRLLLNRNKISEIHEVIEMIKADVL